MFLEEGCNVKYAAEIKKHVSCPVATVGALTDVELMEEIELKTLRWMELSEKN